MENQEFKRCPFCGADIEKKVVFAQPRGIHPQNDCHLKGKIMSAVHWNRRAPLQVEEEGEPRQGGEPSGLVWSREKPKVKGDYRHRIAGEQNRNKWGLSYVHPNNGMPMWWDERNEEWSDFARNVEIEWAGPIPAPRTQAAQPPAEAPEADQPNKPIPGCGDPVCIRLGECQSHVGQSPEADGRGA